MQLFVLFFVECRILLALGRSLFTLGRSLFALGRSLFALGELLAQAFHIRFTLFGLGDFGDLGLLSLPPPALPLALATGLGLLPLENLHLSPKLHSPKAAKLRQTVLSAEAMAAVALSAGGCPSFFLFAFAFAAAALRSSRLVALAAAAAGTF